MMKKAFAMFLSLLLMTSLVACGGNKPADEPPDNAVVPESEDVFRISTYLQLSGNNGDAGNNAKNGVDLAAKYINENGGFNGATVVTTHYDTTGSTEEAAKIVQKILENNAADAVIGSVNSNEVSAALPYLNEAEMYNFGLGTSATWMEDQSYVWTFRASANNNRIAPLGADMIKDDLGFTKVAVFSSTDDTGRSTADTFVDACKERGMTVTTRQECDPSDTDFAGQITQLIASDPEIIYLSLHGNTFGPAVKQLRNMGYNGMLAGKETFAPSNIAGAGAENSNYITFVYPYVIYNTPEECNIPIMKSFLELYYKEYGEMPIQEAAYRAWDTMMSMWEASKIAGSNDSAALRDATHKVQIEGLGGNIDFTKGDREAYSAFYSFILVDGESGVSVPLADWLADGGMEEYKAATGR